MKESKSLSRTNKYDHIFQNTRKHQRYNTTQQKHLNKSKKLQKNKVKMIPR